MALPCCKNENEENVIKHAMSVLFLSLKQISKYFIYEQPVKNRRLALNRSENAVKQKILGVFLPNFFMFATDEIIVYKHSTVEIVLNIHYNLFFTMPISTPIR